MTVPRFAGAVTHDLLAGYDPADILADVAYRTATHRWPNNVPPEWVKAVRYSDERYPVDRAWTGGVAWLLDMALAGKLPTEVES